MNNLQMKEIVSFSLGVLDFYKQTQGKRFSSVASRLLALAVCHWTQSAGEEGVYKRNEGTRQPGAVNAKRAAGFHLTPGSTGDAQIGRVLKNFSLVSQNQRRFASRASATGMILARESSEYFTISSKKEG